MNKRVVRRTQPALSDSDPWGAHLTARSVQTHQDAQDVWDRRFRKAMSLKDDLHLSDDERYALAQWIPGVDKDTGGSWRELSSNQLHELLTLMEGFLLVSHLFAQRG